MKICTECKTEKELKDFGKDRQKNDGLQYNCKNCRNKKHKEYRLNNPDKIKEGKKKYRKENKEKMNQKEKEYHKKRRKNDPNFRLRGNLRSLTYKVIKNGYKSASTQELLGCTWEEAIIYIENQFVDGMTWENRSEWEIDHIRPIASFTDLTDPEQQRQCCHYTNLRPLWAKDNRNKSSWWNGIKH